jgi:hypothetical protein
VVSDDRLVGGHDGLAGAERGGDQRAGRLDAAHQLDDHIRVGVGHDVGRRVGQHPGRKAIAARPAEIADRDRRELDRRTVGGHEPVRVVGEPVDDSAADRPGTEHRHAQRRTAHGRGS